MAGNKVSLGDVVRRLDGFVTKAEVRNCYAACFLGVILEVCLNVFVGVVTDDFDGVLVCTDCSVSAESPEFASDGSFGSRIGSRFFFEGVTGNIVNDADREAVLRFVSLEVFIYCEYGSGSCIFGAETVTSADNLCCNAFFSESCDNIKLKRLAE